jgi:hypothetical protein
MIAVGWDQSGRTQEAPASQEQNKAPRAAKPEEIPFNYDASVFSKVRIEETPKRVVQPDSFPDEAPAHSCFHLEDKRSFPAFEKGPRYFQPAYSVVCILPLTDKSETDFAKSYPYLSDAAVKLRKLLARRPAQFRFDKDLIDLAFNNASGVIKSRVQYLNFKNGQGVLFLTQYSQELHANPINNEELTCNFQGITNDGKYYVAARFALTHPSLPRGIDFTSHIERDDKQLYLKKQERALNGYADGSFQPSLRVLKSLIASISAK